jgi:large subunit ribosomal protein L9
MLDRPSFLLRKSSIDIERSEIRRTSFANDSYECIRINDRRKDFSGEKKMKVILKDDVEKLGKCGEVVEVKDGYGRNFLIARNLAIPAIKGNLKAIREVTKQKQMRDLKKKKQEERLKIQLEKISCTAEVRVGEEDKVFGSVTAQDISELLKEKGFEIDRHKILLETPIKALGVYTVPIKISGDVVASLKVWVMKKQETLK